MALFFRLNLIMCRLSSMTEEVIGENQSVLPMKRSKADWLYRVSDFYSHQTASGVSRRMRASNLLDARVIKTLHHLTRKFNYETRN
jgi:hypothetical protein